MTTKMTGLLTLGLLCWMVMFLAGTDVWRFAGRPDFWHLSGPPNADLRAFVVAFYLQFVVLVAMAGLVAWTARASRRGTIGRGRDSRVQPEV
jgi:hypothetical protein